MKPSLPILVTSVVFVGTIAVLGVAIERQVAPAPLPEPKKDPCGPVAKDGATADAKCGEPRTSRP